MEINTPIIKDIEQYCIINELDINSYLASLIKRAYMLDKYGDRPDIYSSRSIDAIVPDPVKREAEYDIEYVEPKKVTRKRKPKVTEEEPKEEKQEQVVEVEEVVKKPRKRKITL